MQSSLVIGLGFGDEGKGLTTSYLCSLHPGSVVVRFNGGHQAGHTVVDKNGRRHVFSSFGSGTLNGAPSYWSRFCTVYPIALMNEYNALLQLGVQPKLTIHPLAPVTTPFDITANQEQETQQKHGSVGVGFGKTLDRHEKYYKLYFQDLFNDTILRAKLANIASFYGVKDHPKLGEFLLAVSDMRKVHHHIKMSSFVREASEAAVEHVIFEGAQGLLLDQDFGFFPNVTRSNTTSKNIWHIMEENGNFTWPLDVYYVTRWYQTRHGNGFMSNDKKPLLINNENETNRPHPWQGEFKTAILDYDLLSYALECDAHFSKEMFKHLVITCMDQNISGEIPIKVGDKYDIVSPEVLCRWLSRGGNTPLTKLYTSSSDDGQQIKEVPW